ncbi:MAG: hypothetical protein ABI823_01845 [Bryobacteraceae bacterium]
MRIQGSCQQCNSGAQSAPSSRTSRASQRLDAQRASSFQLKLTTAEGDKVTISAEALQALSASSSADGQQAQSASGLSVKVSVQGDLNEQELKDIVKLAQALGTAVSDARSGNIQQAAQDVADTREGSTVAQFDFRYRDVQRYRYESQAASGVSVAA